MVSLVMLHLMVSPARGFQLHASPVDFAKRCMYRNSRLVLLASEENDAPGEVTCDSKESSVGRAGGRRRRRHWLPSLPTRIRSNSLLPPLLLFSLLLVIVPLFSIFGESSTPSMYYYQSSSYESRVYDSSDGSVRTTKQTSVQTNMPSLLEGSRLVESNLAINEGYARPSIEHDDF